MKEAAFILISLFWRKKADPKSYFWVGPFGLQLACDAHAPALSALFIRGANTNFRMPFPIG
ncbi:hypothetical protein [Pseudobacillus badius]|uniref:hypothetical protein n=1 Tax=Bacillus badius TaxID=1455 RepID=UPI0007B3F518|nr:hypothetical protein [Bacillus badius]KZR59571.1 hypothetical protein A3781_10925 [Bacillus badius]